MTDASKGRMASITEAARLQVVNEIGEPSEISDPDFSTIAEMAAACMQAPIGLVSLVGETTQVFLGAFGTELRESPIEDAFCAHTIAEKGNDPLIVTDARVDERFAASGLVVNDPNIRFYTGVPLTVRGQKIGTVCVIDTEPRENADPDGIDQLRRLSFLASSFFELKESARSRHSADLARRRAEFRHSLALRAATISSWMWNVKANLVTIDDTLQDWSGIDPNMPISIQDLLSIVHPEDMESVNVALNMTLSEGVDFRCEFRVAGSDTWMMGQGSIYERTADGQPLSIAGVFVDISETKRSEQTTRLLLLELNHRVKNTLAMLQSLAAQTLKRTSTPDDFMRAFSGRLQALAAAHTLLSDNRWHRLSVQSLLQTLILPYAYRHDNSIEIEGTDTRIGPDEGLGLGLVIHELATNAARHGALLNKTGAVHIKTSVEEKAGTQVLNIEWNETGGPRVIAPKQTGFGSILIERGLQKTLGSHVTMRYDPEGFSASISLPISERMPVFKG